MPRGGARAGAGRKTIADDKRRVQMTIYVLPETKASLDRLKEKGVTAGQLLDGYIRQLDSPEK